MLLRRKALLDGVSDEGVEVSHFLCEWETSAGQRRISGVIRVEPCTARHDEVYLDNTVLRMTIDGKQFLNTD